MAKPQVYCHQEKEREGKMKTKTEQFSSNNPNPVLSVEKDGTVLYSNKAGEPLLHEWSVGVGEKLPPYFIDIVKGVTSINAPQKMEVKVGNRVYVLLFHSLPEEECVNIYGFDISDQKELEEKLRESEKKYHGLFENMLDGFAYCRMIYDDCSHPVDFIYLDTNSAFEGLTGLKEATGKRVTEVIPGIKELYPELFDAYSRVALTGHPEKFEIEFKPLGLWLLVSVYSMEREHLVAVFENITERKHAEETLQEAYEKLQVQSEEIQVQSEELQAQSEEIQVQYEELQAQSEELHKAYESLHESENKFRTLTENSPDLIARFDRQNRHTYANSAAVELYGCSQEEIVGKTHTELGRDPELVKLWERHYENVFTTGKIETIEFQYTSPQGKEYYFNTRIVPEFVNSEVISVLAISRDITERKKSEEKIEILANIVESSNDAIVTESFEGIITSWNKGAEQTYGYSAEEILGKNISILELDNRKGEIKHFSEKIKHGEQIQHYETSRLKKDGTLISGLCKSQIHNVYSSYTLKTY